MATWAENEELIRLGAYRAGSSQAVDAAIARIDAIRAFLSQGVADAATLDSSVVAMEKIVNGR
jgi:flagellum-specific ATP synthase